MSSPTVYLRDIESRPRFMTTWERYKHREAHWLAESVGEMLGVFFYVYAGVGATASFVVGTLTGQTGLGCTYKFKFEHVKAPPGDLVLTFDPLALHTVGFAYSIGIVLAVTICGATSGGHFNPAVTLAFAIFKGFPLRKTWRYIIAQILGAYIACLVIYVQWKDLLDVAEEVLSAKGLYDTVMFSPNGPAGVFALYVSPTTNLHRVLLNEFVTDFAIGLVIWGCLDPTNHLAPPAFAPWIIGFTYGIAVWGYSPTSLAANSCRDIGARLMAMTIWGTRATGGRYAAITALTNIPATILAALVYETFLGSSSRTLTPVHIQYLSAHKKYVDDNDLAPPGYLGGLQPGNFSSSQYDMDEHLEKDATQVLEVTGTRV
ncbi:hypothetical protein SERLADRAFT_438411 [Serpula lacrymans var. lacrymans S7.9]|uniref:Aquaporin-like protein n=1 Tax=Serpula lacrymans var. lacrymans (strain S7.9) TaxID=578457 RepID=F8NY47_SERL9|nr:uncharacterized protein SERLADRAFT_438411 [Serpula lacrymans var. lacrymans S7.9]EGO24809.1 hypothetical protein SERLADRAFT_438411 [Serpula lacrymans var. lacrymans S7.9]